MTKAGNRTIRTAGVAAIVALTLVRPPEAQSRGWSGNMAKNPGFEEDFVNINSESHVLSFKGDWYYNQKDLVPDYWVFKGGWSHRAGAAHSGKHSLKLEAGAEAHQSYQRAMTQSGGGAWGGAKNTPIPISADEKARFQLSWRATVQVRGGGKIRLGGAEATIPASPDWKLLTVECSSDKLPDPSKQMTIKLIGPGEFDDLVVQEILPNAPNLVANAGFEAVAKDGYPKNWGRQKKFRAIGPTYYVWTDWNHAFRANRGPVTTDSFVTHGGRHSLRFDVYPGDEKLVESDLIILNQDKPRIIEASVFVRADRIKLIDIRMVDQDGDYMAGYRPRQPEYKAGGSFLFGNGTFEWRYVRKFFVVPNNKPVKGVRVRLCARGMNGHTLDDAGTRSYCMQVGTVWWDDVRVMERTTDAAALKARGVTFPKQTKTKSDLAFGTIDLGERFFGENMLTYSFNAVSGGKYQLKLITTLPGKEPVETSSKVVRLSKGASGKLEVPYTVDKLAGELEKQATFDLLLLNGKKVAARARYAFNTWPVIVDVDVARHYNLPNENPVTVSMNLGVADRTLARVTKLETQLRRRSDGKILVKGSLSSPTKALEDTRKRLPTKQTQSYEFGFPTPAWWVDRTKLIITKIDLSKLKIYPHDNPVRDTVFIIRGLDKSGGEVFQGQSDPFCRMQAPPPQDPIRSVRVREDGAILINGKPRYLFGATHQNQRTQHDFPKIASLGLMGHRLLQGKATSFENVKSLWDKHRLYALQTKPVSGMGGTIPVKSMTQEQKKQLEEFVKAGGMQNVISMNSGGWEATIDFNNEQQVAQHKAVNDWIRKTTKRPVAISTSGAFNAWWLRKLVLYDINHAETEMWGPMDFNVIFTPYMKRAGKTTAWVYLPQLYDNHPYERYRFETYENIIRGSAGVSMIQGIGDPTFNRGLAGELRYLEGPLNSLDKAPAVTLKPGISHKVTRYKGKTYILATNCGPIFLGRWKWNNDTKYSGKASHEGDSHNTQWPRPAGIRIHGFRGMPMPELIRKGDKIVQYIWIDAGDKPDWAMVAVRGDGRFAYNAILGKFDFNKFKSDLGHILMYSELNHSVWHEINWICTDEVYRRGVKLMGKPWADRLKKLSDSGIKKVEQIAYKREHFHTLGKLPKAGDWYRIEIDAEKVGLTGRLVDGFAYITQNGRALWDYSVLERDGKVVRVFCEDTIGIDRALLTNVRINVPKLKAGTKINVLFEDRTIEAEDGGFSDNFEGTDTYGYESGAVNGDLFGYVKDPDRELAVMMPSGTGYEYGPTDVHIYEIKH